MTFPIIIGRIIINETDAEYLFSVIKGKIVTNQKNPNTYDESTIIHKPDFTFMGPDSKCIIGTGGTTRLYGKGRTIVMDGINKETTIRLRETILKNDR
jgi:hypothetical protein